MTLRLTLRKTGPVRSKKPAQAEQKRPENRHRRPRAPTPYIIWNIFICSLVVSFKFIVFNFFRPKRPGTRARTVVPLTMPLPIFIHWIIQYVVIVVGRNNVECRTKIGLAVLQLLESGDLLKLKKKWWLDKGECPVDVDSKVSSEYWC